jgi:uncharacterized protein
MTGRIFDRAFAWQMSQAQADAAAELLAGTAARLFGQPDQVIAIAGGGIAPGTAAARRLRVPLLTVRAQHNPTSALYTQATGKVRCVLDEAVAASLHGRVLVVDDICGTGATFDAVTSAVTEAAGPGVRLHTAALCRNAGAAARPAITIWDELREWVIFPWEPAPPPGSTTRPLPAPVRAHTG